MINIKFKISSQQKRKCLGERLKGAAVESVMHYLFLENSYKSW